MIKELFKKVIPWLDIDNKIYKKYLKSHNLYKKGKKRHAYYVCYRIQKKYNCVISPQAIIGKNFRIPHPLCVVIGKDAVIGDNFTIYQGVTIGQNNDKFPVIGDNVTVFAGAKIIGGIKIGNNVIVGANSVVTHDVPDNCVVAGIPAREIKARDSE